MLMRAYAPLQVHHMEASVDRVANKYVTEVTP